MDLSIFASAQIPQDLGEDVFNSALEALSNMSTDEGLDPTLLAEKCMNNCLEVLETGSSQPQELRNYSDCEKELDYFIVNARQKNILNFLVKLLEHPSVQRQEILFNAFSVFLTERKYSNYLILAYLLTRLDVGAFEQFHNYVGLNHSINGGSILSSILVSGTPPVISDYDRIFSAILIYHNACSSTKLIASFKSLIDLYLSLASSRNISKVSESLNFPPKNLLSYILTVLFVCPDLLKVNIFTIALSQANVANIIELELHNTSEIRLTEGFEVKVSMVYVNILNSLAVTCLNSPGSYTDFFIILENICSFAGSSTNAFIRTAANVCEEFQSKLFEKIQKLLFHGCTDLSQPKFSAVQEFDRISDNVDRIITSLNYIPKSEEYNPKNVVSLLFLVGLYKGAGEAERILTELITNCTSHKSVFLTSFEFLNASFSRYWAGISMSTLNLLLSKSYYSSPKKSLVLLKNLVTLIGSSAKALYTIQPESLVILLLKRLPFIINQVKNSSLTKLSLGILKLADECVSCINNSTFGPSFTVTFELVELIYSILRKITTDKPQLDVMDENLELSVVSLTIHSCQGVADISHIFDRLLDALWANSYNFSSSLRKDIITSFREQSDITKHLCYSVFEEITGVKNSTNFLEFQRHVSLLNTPKSCPETQMPRSAQKYVINLISTLIHSNQKALPIIQTLFLNRFSHLSESLSDPKPSEALDKKYLLSKRSSELWRIFENREALWDIVSILSRDESFLLRAVPMLLPLIRFVTYLWSGKKKSDDLGSKKNFEMTVKVFKVIEKLAPDPLNKVSLILDLIAENEITILGHALELVLETIFYNPNLQYQPQATEVPYWDSILRDIRHIVTENIHTIGDTALFFLTHHSLAVV